MGKFNFNTIKDFDKHIELSIPNYQHLSSLVRSISTYFISKDSNVYDLGCSSGLLLKEMSIETRNRGIAQVNFIGYDITDNMINQSYDLETPLNFHFEKKNITVDLNLVNTNLVLSIFTLQFLKPDDRWEVIRNVYKQLNSGGAMIIAEKVFTKYGFMQDLFTFSYYDYKQKSFTAEEILKKQSDLREIMRPLSSEQNVAMFKDCGFECVECFFQSLLFKAWVLVK